MSKKSSTADRGQLEDGQNAPSRQEIEMALARLQKIAESLPPVDVVAIVREGRDTSQRT
jgi:hypothetical protein